MDDLLERTRVACLDRVRDIRALLEQVREPGDRGLDAVLRQLHAIKGEAAMGGLGAVGKLAHALEELVLQRRSAEPFHIDDVRAAMRELADVLANGTAQQINEGDEVADLIREVRASTDERATPAVAEPRAPAPVVSTASSSSRGEEPPVQQPRPAARPLAGAMDGGQLRVEAKSIDDLSNLLSDMAVDLEATRALLAEAPRRFHGKVELLVHAVNEELDGLRSKIAQAEARSWSLRLVPLSPMLQGLAEHVEALAAQLGKHVRVEVRATGVALERGVVDALREPLLHLVRNAVDHGIELPEDRGEKPSTCTIRLHAESQGTETVVVVEDDGVGLDVDSIRRRAVELGLLLAERARVLSREEVLDLVFAQGFSQREAANELSGRGVGLGAVRSRIERMGGAVRLTTSPGRGSRFELVLPAAVARERVLVVESAGLPWAIPSRWVRAVVRDEVSLVQAREKRLLRTQDGLSPARPLSAWLRAPREVETAAIVVSIAGRRTALLVARILAEVDLLRAPSDPLLEAATRVAASGILDDGRVAFFLRWAEVLREAAQLTHDGVVEAKQSQRLARVLVVDDSPVIRDIVGEVLSGAHFEVVTAEDGKQALDILARDPFDLVLSDIEMPRMTGLELLAAIRERDTLLPVIMLTTRSKPEHRREAALLGANAYIAKSEFHGDTLLEVVRRFVDAPR